MRGSAAIACALALAVAGCGKTEVDRAKAEGFVRSFFNPEAQSATCPDGVEAKRGRTFTCTAVLADGKRRIVTVHVLDDQGRVQIGLADVRPAP